MAIPEVRLETWSHQGAIATSATTFNTIKDVLENAGAPYADKRFRVFLQGSYGNNTNVYAESDVDIAICLTSVNYYDVESLSEPDKERFEVAKSLGNYSFRQFEDDVLAWLHAYFGGGVRAGNKAILVPGNNGRRDADVLVCVEHRKYLSFPSRDEAQFLRGICFWTADNTKIVNYPDQHSENCTQKHQQTANRFKPNVRVLKNMRNVMVDRGYLDDGVAPSYFLEGMLWNLPNDQFEITYARTFLSSLIWLGKCDPTRLHCANNIHWLIRDAAPVSWNQNDFDTFRTGAFRFWQEY